MANLSLERLMFDASNPTDGPSIGSFLIGASGSVISSTGTYLDVNVTNGIDVDVVHTSDSVSLGDGTNLLTSHNSGSDYGLDVWLLNSSIAVTASDLDIRALDHTSGGINDSVRLGDGTNYLTSSTVSSDIGLDVYLINSSIAVTGSVSVSVPNTALACVAVSVASTETALPSSALAARKLLQIQNNGDKPVFIGPTGLSVSNGLEIAKGATETLEVGPSVVVYGICASGTVDCRVLELS